VTDDDDAVDDDRRRRRRDVAPIEDAALGIQLVVADPDMQIDPSLFAEGLQGVTGLCVERPQVRGRGEEKDRGLAIHY
jgi:hypothetical protein